jgi:hypothetical protein
MISAIQKANRILMASSKRSIPFFAEILATLTGNFLKSSRTFLVINSGIKQGGGCL